MNIYSVLPLFLILCYLSAQQCYAGEADVLREFLKARRTKTRNIMSQGLAEKQRSVSKFIVPQVGSKKNDKISALPGQPKGINFAQYSGYVTVDANAGRALFYYFAESSNDPPTKPLVLWLNGGPGCSSFGNGGMAELGPFRVSEDGKTLWLNPFAWNKVANVLFLESPAGVGFSYSNTSSDYTTGDEKTRQDSFTFLLNWMERFPEYKNRDFYIVGESYAGHYVPQLAQLILSQKKTKHNLVINLQGIATGNALLDDETRNSGSYDFYWTHALISDEVHDGIVKNCNFSTETSTSEACDKYTSEADSCQANIYSYNTYSQLCNSSSYTSLPIDGFDPCSADYVFNYLNTAEVQKALNVRDIPHSWESCSDDIGGYWQDSPNTVLPIFQELMQSGIRVWIYSGDVDHILSVTTSRYAINKIKTPVKTAWYPWFFNGEVGGYAVEYQNLTFVTVRGAGHLVPSYQPGRALTMFSSFINGTLPPGRKRMNISSVLSLILILCYLSAPQCYAGEVDVLREFLKARRTKTTNVISQGVAVAEKQRSVSEFIVPQVGSKENDKISALPGQPSGINFAQYSGYVTVNADAGRALFYYLAESSNDPATKPLVLWLNGGPGCSSFGNGGMVELGPFRVNKDGKTLWLNQFAWNNVANVLFLESPAGVGFSYSNTSSDYTSGDEKTRQDSFTFLVNWMERFPEYKNRDFYIVGESYAGHYVPQLAQLILSHKKSEPNLVINLQGIATGNALLDDETSNSGSYDLYWSHALISDEVHEGIIKNCNFSTEATTSEACDEFTSEADSCQANIYDYNTYSQLCNSSAYTSLPTDGFDPCSADYVFNYLNTAEVQKALNVRDIPQSWESCSGISWEDSPHTVLPIFQELMQSGIRVWIYSGDIDHILPVTTSRYAIDKIKTPIKTAWYPWFFQGEVGGYAVEYQNLTFATVRGAGHFVPSYQPGRALTMFSSFINGTLPPRFN
ncbi:hypothetical protein EJD97_023415 [Solanum chilense]|uniref:Carboxypeptidase n=1 Tax=Solanum chilense TaxID=4083 RepID=A0A6N2AU41_SOLCI|nr:hypothetical protein EJD97_023415 [Solanum chilense]